MIQQSQTHRRKDKTRILAPPQIKALTIEHEGDLQEEESFSDEDNNDIDEFSID